MSQHLSTSEAPEASKASGFGAPEGPTDSGTPEAPALGELGKLTDHELRWALRESIGVMYQHLGLTMEEE